MTKKLTDEEKVERATERSSKLERRQRERVLIAKGFVRCKPYLANLALYNDIPTEEGPGLADTDVQWVPAWFEWHLQRFKHTSLADVSQRERLQQAKALMEDKEAQLLLLCEAQLAGSTLEDPSGDLSTAAAIELLKKELDGS